MHRVPGDRRAAKDGDPVSASNRNVVGCMMAVLYLFMHVPLYYYLFYRILQAVHADTTMWVLFWIYAPVGMACSIAAKAIELTKEG